MVLEEVKNIPINIQTVNFNNLIQLSQILNLLS